jgi:tumor protein p53-inducible protein 3
MDVNQRQGHYPPPPGASEILGVEVSGIVEEVGKDGTSAYNNHPLNADRACRNSALHFLLSFSTFCAVKGFKVGDAVFGLLPGGGYAEVR